MDLSKQYSVPKANNFALGNVPADGVSDTDAHTGEWQAMLALEDTVVSSITDAAYDSGAITSFTIPSFAVYFGYITAVTLTSGKVKLFKR